MTWLKFMDIPGRHELDPIAEKIEAALAAGLVTEAHAAIEVLDELDAPAEGLEPEDDGGNAHAEPADNGLAISELLRVVRLCFHCGNVHSCEEIPIS